MSKQAWSGWLPVSPRLTLSPSTLAEILDGGQSFRWQCLDGVWTGCWSVNRVQLRLAAGALEWRAPAGRAADVSAPLRRYLALDTDWPALTDALPWRSDAHLAQCIAAFPGLRLLRQPFGETLLGFLCSATKQIVQIKQMVALLAERHGLPLSGCRSGFMPRSFAALSRDKPAPTVFHRLPTWAELAGIPERDLRQCLLGFRAKFIHATARHIASRPGWLEETEHLPYPEAKARLLELPGVGEKVADCVLLFGACRLAAFPVDTWVLKSLARRYGLGGWKPGPVAHFGRTHFGLLAGLAQQYLFAWERKYGTR